MNLMPFADIRICLLSLILQGMKNQ